MVLFYTPLCMSVCELQIHRLSRKRSDNNVIHAVMDVNPTLVAGAGCFLVCLFVGAFAFEYYRLSSQ